MPGTSVTRVSAIDAVSFSLYLGRRTHIVLGKYLKFILLFLFAALMVWFFVRKLNWNEVSHSLSQANPWYLGYAAAIISFGYLLRAVRWRVLLEPITPSS